MFPITFQLFKSIFFILPPSKVIKRCTSFVILIIDNNYYFLYSFFYDFSKKMTTFQYFFIINCINIIFTVFIFYFRFHNKSFIGLLLYHNDNKISNLPFFCIYIFIYKFIYIFFYTIIRIIFLQILILFNKTMLYFFLSF